MVDASLTLLEDTENFRSIGLMWKYPESKVVSTVGKCSRVVAAGRHSLGARSNCLTLHTAHSSCDETLCLIQIIIP